MNMDESGRRNHSDAKNRINNFDSFDDIKKILIQAEPELSAIEDTILHRLRNIIICTSPDQQIDKLAKLSNISILILGVIGVMLGVILTVPGLSDDVKYVTIVFYVIIAAILICFSLFIPQTKNEILTRRKTYALSRIIEKMSGQVAMQNSAFDFYNRIDKMTEKHLSDMIDLTMTPEEEERLFELSKKATISEDEARINLRVNVPKSFETAIDGYNEDFVKVLWKILACTSLKVNLYVRISRQVKGVNLEILVPVGKYPATGKDLNGMQGSLWLKSDNVYIWSALERGIPQTNQEIGNKYSDRINFHSFKSSKKYSSIVAMPIFGKCGVISLYSDEKGALSEIDPCVINTIITCYKTLIEKAIRLSVGISQDENIVNRPAN